MESLIKEEDELLRKMKEVKEAAEEADKEDKQGTPWYAIDPELITIENLRIFNQFQESQLKGFPETMEEIDKLNNDLDSAAGIVKLAKEKNNEIKDAKKREANENLLRYMDDEIDRKRVTLRKKIEE